MLRPVGPLPSRIYWRRRIVLVVVILIVAWVGYALLPGGSRAPTAAPGAGSGTSPAPTPSAAPTPSGPPTTSAEPTTSPAPTTASSSPAPAACDLARLSISAAPSAPSYPAGSEPMLYLQVVNPGPLPCQQDLADREVELRIYQGASRLWGSHDCLVQPGTDLRTLTVNVAVRVGVPWSGRTSQPGCAGARQLVGAGSYTLHALLGGTDGTPASFTIS